MILTEYIDQKITHKNLFHFTKLGYECEKDVKYKKGSTDLLYCFIIFSSFSDKEIGESIHIIAFSVFEDCFKFFR